MCAPVNIGFTLSGWSKTTEWLFKRIDSCTSYFCIVMVEYDA